jgi:hypothetical protein
MQPQPQVDSDQTGLDELKERSLRQAAGGEVYEYVAGRELVWQNST